MTENVGRTDQFFRSIVGPALLAIGVSMVGRRPLAGLAAAVSGALVVESAITRTCPLNYLAGLDTREPALRAADVYEAEAQLRRAA